jgi:6-phosphogluconolactonase
LRTAEPTVIVHEDPPALAAAVAKVFLELCVKAARDKGYFTAVLSGGSTPMALYSALASEVYRGRIPWDRVHLFWGDERCVGPEDADSNYGAAYGALVSSVGIPPGNVHRMRGEIRPEDAAKEYEEELLSFFSGREGARPGGRTSSFDLVLLGLGMDGHTLSLFPSSDALKEEKRLVVACGAKDGGHRLTMTLPLVAGAANAVFLVSGGAKAGILREVLEGPVGRYPAQMVRLSGGGVSWHVDRAAAVLLRGPQRGSSP